MSPPKKYTSKNFKKALEIPPELFMTLLDEWIDEVPTEGQRARELRSLLWHIKYFSRLSFFNHLTPEEVEAGFHPTDTRGVFP